jgi:hypothetical protein
MIRYCIFEPRGVGAEGGGSAKVQDRPKPRRIGNEGWDPVFEFEVREALTDTQELSGSAEIIIHVKGAHVDDVTVHESADPDEFPYNGVHGHHPELGEVFLFSQGAAVWRSSVRRSPVLLVELIARRSHERHGLVPPDLSDLVGSELRDGRTQIPK